MALMTSTGAKGSQVNFSQISCLLGQQVSRAAPLLILVEFLTCHFRGTA
jgi:DNA-directed RNA polymerase beta' subunit